MKKENVVRIAQVVISNREQLVVLRPVDRLLTVSILHYDAAVRPAAAFNDDLPDEDVSAQELKLAKMLIDTTRADDPELDQYHNLYNDRLKLWCKRRSPGRKLPARLRKDMKRHGRSTSCRY
jgi:non-homologous end joining protein Ku